MREGKGVEVQDNEEGGAGEVGHKVGHKVGWLLVTTGDFHSFMVIFNGESCQNES
jgi:hypothetical protein